MWRTVLGSICDTAIDVYNYIRQENPENQPWRAAWSNTTNISTQLNELQRTQV